MIAIVQPVNVASRGRGAKSGTFARSVNRCLEENRELSNRLIDLALQNEEDMFNVAFGDGSSGVKPERVSPPPVDTEGVSRRQRELAEQAYHRNPSSSIQLRTLRVRCAMRRKNECICACASDPCASTCQSLSCTNDTVLWTACSGLTLDVR